MVSATATRCEECPSLVRPPRHYPQALAGAWWAHGTPEERRAALEAKLDREQPLPTYRDGHR